MRYQANRKYDIVFIGFSFADKLLHSELCLLSKKQELYKHEHFWYDKISFNMTTAIVKDTWKIIILTKPVVTKVTITIH